MVLLFASLKHCSIWKLFDHTNKLFFSCCFLLKAKYKVYRQVRKIIYFCQTFKNIIYHFIFGKIVLVYTPVNLLTNQALAVVEIDGC